MRKTLGRLVSLLLLTAAILWGAPLEVKVSSHKIAKGDTVTLTLKASGKEVTFPTLREIGGFAVLGTSKSSSIAIENGEVRRSVQKSYTFAPMRSVTVGPFKVTIDGQVYTAGPVRIEVVDTPSQGRKDRGVSFELSLQKNRARVGEPVMLRLTVRYPAQRPVVEVRFDPPQLDNVWVKQVGGVEKREVNGSVEQSQTFLLFPQKAGEYTVGPFTARVAERVRIRSGVGDPFFDEDLFNTFFSRLQWRRIHSKSRKLHVEPLPGGVAINGKFTLRVEANATEVEADRPVDFIVVVEGEGNIEDLDPFNPQIEGAAVYPQDPEVKEWLKNGRYGGRFRQRITVVADRDFTFPSLTLRYFDPKKERVVEKRSAPIFVRVKGGHQGRRHEVQKPSADLATPHREQKQKELTGSTSEYSWLFFILGLFLGGVGGWIFAKKEVRVAAGKPMTSGKAIRKAKDAKTLYRLLLPYVRQDARIAQALRALEGEIYGGKKAKIDKEELARIVEILTDANG